MISSTARSRLFELRRDRGAARRSAELLDRKREVLVREVARRTARRNALRDTVTASYAAAQHELRIACVEHGHRAIAAAALAQPDRTRIEKHSSAVMGVRIAELRVAVPPFQAFYGAAATRASLDRAGVAFTHLLADALLLAAEDAALSRLSTALRKTTRLVNALQKIVLPRIDREIRMTLEGIEEEERDEALRRKCRAHAVV
jgi:V/A-type H+-transporting ATPase subunit D